MDARAARSSEIPREEKELQSWSKKSRNAKLRKTPLLKDLAAPRRPNTLEATLIGVRIDRRAKRCTRQERVSQLVRGVRIHSLPGPVPSSELGKARTGPGLP